MSLVRYLVLQRLKVCHLQPDWLSCFLTTFCIWLELQNLCLPGQIAVLRCCTFFWRDIPWKRPLMSCFRTSHHTWMQLWGKTCLIAYFAAFAAARRGKSPQTARACLCKQRSISPEWRTSFGQIDTCLDISWQLPSSGATSKWKSRIYVYLPLCLAFFPNHLHSADTAKPGESGSTFPIFVWTVVCLIMFCSSPSHRHRLSCSSWQYFYVNKPNRQRQTKLANHRIDNNTRPDGGWCPNEPRVLASSSPFGFEQLWLILRPHFASIHLQKSAMSIKHQRKNQIDKFNCFPNSLPKVLPRSHL